LDHLGPRLGLVRELGLLCLAQSAQGPTGLTQRGVQACGSLTKRRALRPRPPLGHAVEVECWNQTGGHGKGHRWCHVQLTDLLPPLPRDERAGRLPFGHPTLGLRAPIEAGRAAAFWLGHGANPADLCSQISSNALAVAPHASLSITTMVGMAHGADTLGDLRALRAEALGLLVRGCRFLCDLGEADGGLWGATRTLFFRGGACALTLLLSLRQPLLRCGGHLRRRPRLGGHRA
jgi:hypothetical protein